MSPDEEEIKKAIRALKDIARKGYSNYGESIPATATRVEAAASIGAWMPRREAVDALIEILNDSDCPEPVRSAAARSLGKRD